MHITKTQFRVRSKQPRIVRDVSLNSYENGYQDLKQKKLMSQKIFEINYGSVKNVNLRLREMIRKQSTIENQSTLPSIKLEKQNFYVHVNKERKRDAVLSTITNFHTKESQRSFMRDNFSLNQQLIKQQNYFIWDQLEDINLRNNKEMNLLYKKSNVIFDKEPYSLKIVQKHKKYFIKLLSFENKYTKVLSQQEWKELWRIYKSYERISANIVLQDGKISIKQIQGVKISGEISEEIFSHTNINNKTNQQYLNEQITQGVESRILQQVML